MYRLIKRVLKIYSRLRIGWSPKSQTINCSYTVGKDLIHTNIGNVGIVDPFEVANRTRIDHAKHNSVSNVLDQMFVSKEI